MTSQPPTDFENYPLQRERDGISDPAMPPAAPLAPYRPPTVGPSPQPQPSTGIGRRGVLSLIIGLPVAGVLGATLFSLSGEGASSGDATAEASEAIEIDPDESGDYVDLGGQYSAQVPEGWESVTPEGDETVLVHGDNRLVALIVTPDGSQGVTDQLFDLVEEYRGRFSGDLPEPIDTLSSDVRRATLTTTGSVGGDGARLRADLWFDVADNGLLVIQTLTARKGSRIAAEAQAIADELTAGF